MKKPQTSKISKESGSKRVKMSSFCAMDGETLILNVLGTPSAKKDVIGKPRGAQLKISVTASPVAGRATDHMVKFIAKQFGVATADVTVVFGRFNINKQLRIYAPQTLPPVISKALSAEKKSSSQPV